MIALSKLLGRAGARRALLGVGLMGAMAALLLFPGEAMAAARDGLTLCFNVIIPSLFPFFVLSALVVELGFASCLGRALEKFMRPVFNVNGACASALALGFVGGYPVGARTAISLYENGLCSKTEAERLLAFCNNSGPAFILGVVGAGVFASSRVGVLLCLVHAAASLCVGVLFRFYKAGETRGAGGSAPRFQARRFTAAFTSAVGGGGRAALNICAFVVFFTVVIRLLGRSGLLPSLAGALGHVLAPLGFDRLWAARLLTGLIEISSGVTSLTGEGAFAGRLTMAAFMLGWAGLSVHCQVLSFLGESGLSVRTYLAGKLLHGLFSAVLAAALFRVVPLGDPLPDLLADQVASIAALDFPTALSLSAAAAWGLFLLFLLLAAAGLAKSGGKKRRGVLK